MKYFYHPHTKLWKGNVFTPVHQSFFVQGGGVSQHALGHIPLLSTWLDTPSPAQCMLEYTPICPVYAGIHTPMGRHPPGQTPPPSADTPLMATAADSTQHTGMLSCIYNILVVIFPLAFLCKHCDLLVCSHTCGKQTKLIFTPAKSVWYGYICRIWWSLLGSYVCFTTTSLVKVDIYIYCWDYVQLVSTKWLLLDASGFSD